MSVHILLLHGPNLSQLGHRDPAQYGPDTLDDLVALARAEAEASDAELTAAQHEAEADLVRAVHAARTDGTDAVVINPGALTHYSYALRDALAMLDVPKVEVHLSNVHGRESFRHTSVVAGACDASIAGLGALGVRLAVHAAARLAQARTDG